jgi:hypothetical protein
MFIGSASIFPGLDAVPKGYTKEITKSTNMASYAIPWWANQAMP